MACPQLPRLLSTLLLAPLVVLVIGASCVPSRGVDESKPLTAAVRQGIDEGKEKFSHAELDALLKVHVRKSGRVDYAGLKKDHAKLKSYLAKLAAAKISTLSRDELFALLINAYNAYTLDLIVRNYPIEGIKKISDPWGTKFCDLGGEKITLDDIEHKYLRPVELFDDPRMHFAINCASIGCPLLSADAYTGERIDKQLDATVRRCLENPRYLRIEDDAVFVTNVLNWFKGDFTQKHGSLSKFLIPYTRDQAKNILEEQGDAAIRHLDYDWDLNDTATEK